MEKTMIQQVMTAPGEIIFREIPVPEVEAGNILVRVQMIGICGSDSIVAYGHVVQRRRGILNVKRTVGVARDNRKKNNNGIIFHSVI